MAQEHKRLRKCMPLPPVDFFTAYILPFLGRNTKLSVFRVMGGLCFGVSVFQLPMKVLCLGVSVFRVQTPRNTAPGQGFLRFVCRPFYSAVARALPGRAAALASFDAKYVEEWEARQRCAATSD